MAVRIVWWFEIHRITYWFETASVTWFSLGRRTTNHRSPTLFELVRITPILKVTVPAFPTRAVEMARRGRQWAGDDGTPCNFCGGAMEGPALTFHCEDRHALPKSEVWIAP